MMVSADVSRRAAMVAILMLETPVQDGRSVSRDTYQKMAPPVTLTARRIARRLSERTEQDITAEDIIAAHAALRSQVPTRNLRAIAGE